MAVLHGWRMVKVYALIINTSILLQEQCALQRKVQLLSLKGLSYIHGIDLQNPACIPGCMQICWGRVAPSRKPSDFLPSLSALAAGACWHRHREGRGKYRLEHLCETHNAPVALPGVNSALLSGRILHIVTNSLKRLKFGPRQK